MSGDTDGHQKKPLTTWCHSTDPVSWCQCDGCVTFRSQHVLLYYPEGEFEDTVDTEPDVEPPKHVEPGCHDCPVFGLCRSCGARWRP